MMAGARVAMMTSALLLNGVGHLDVVLGELLSWMEEHEYESIRQMCGSMSERNVPDPTAFECSSYMRVINSYTHVAPSSESAGEVSRSVPRRGISKPPPSVTRQSAISGAPKCDLARGPAYL
jgi:hypothetical protein